MHKFDFQKFKSVFKNSVNVLASVILVVTLVIVIALVFTRVSGKTPQLFGYQILRVSSSSMSPKLEVGDIILSKRTDPEALKSGDIVTYHGEYGSYSGKLITHQLISEPYKADGRLYFQAKGIANTYVDPEFTDEQIVGKMVNKMPVFSRIYSFFVTPYGLILILGVLGILFINEVFALVRLSKAKDSADENYVTNEKQQDDL